MIYSKILRLLKNHFRNKFVYYFILVSLFVLGNLIGPLIFKKISIESREFIFKLIYPRIGKYNFNSLYYYEILKGRILVNIIFFLILISLSIFQYGFYLIPLIIAIKGILGSYTVSYLVNYYGFKGLAISIITIYPQWAFLIFPVTGFSALAMDIAKNYSYHYGNRFNKFIAIYLKEYIEVTILYLLLFIIASFIEAYSLNLILMLTLKHNV